MQGPSHQKKSQFMTILSFQGVILFESKNKQSKLKLFLQSVYDIKTRLGHFCKTSGFKCTPYLDADTLFAFMKFAFKKLCAI